MPKRRILYLTALGGCVIFYFAYREWFSWFALVGLLCLPWLSLLLSLPAMLTLRLQAQCLVEDAQTLAGVQSKCPLPEPPFRSKFTVIHAITAQRWTLKMGSKLPTEHCGQLKIALKKPRVYDYLGLFSLPVRKKGDCTLLIRPGLVPLAPPPDLTRYRSTAWRPKFGGGFAENHELRLYRPGDDLRQVHWKLSAKTGRLILREPMEPVRGLAVLTLSLCGTPETLDEKLGQLLWLSEHLLRQEVPHRICCLTGTGLQTLPVEQEGDAARTVDALLCEPAADSEEMPAFDSAAWHYHIGGQRHEI